MNEKFFTITLFESQKNYQQALELEEQRMKKQKKLIQESENKVKKSKSL